MYNISSALASQTMSKNMVWKCLTVLGKVTGKLTYSTSNRMIVEGWGVGVRVVIKRGYKGIQVLKGLSTIISPLKIARQIMEQNFIKSVGLNIIRRSERVFLVDSRQDPRNKHVVTAHPDGLTCSCMKFKCLNNRIEKEAPILLKALGEVKLLDNQKACKTEFYDLKKGDIEEKVHIQCHHIRAVMEECFNAFTAQEYVFNWKKVISSYKTQKDSWVSTEQWQQDLEFFPKEWGEFKRKPK